MDHCQTTGAVEIKHTISFFISVHKMTYTSLSCTILRVLYVFCNIVFSSRLTSIWTIWPYICNRSANLDSCLTHRWFSPLRSIFSKTLFETSQEGKAVCCVWFTHKLWFTQLFFAVFSIVLKKRKHLWTEEVSVQVSNILVIQCRSRNWNFPPSAIGDSGVTW